MPRSRAKNPRPRAVAYRRRVRFKGDLMKLMTQLNRLANNDPIQNTLNHTRSAYASSIWCGGKIQELRETAARISAARAAVNDDIDIVLGTPLPEVPALPIQPDEPIIEQPANKRPAPDPQAERPAKILRTSAPDGDLRTMNIDILQRSRALLVKADVSRAFLDAIEVDKKRIYWMKEAGYMLQARNRFEAEVKAVTRSRDRQRRRRFRAKERVSELERRIEELEAAAKEAQTSDDDVIFVRQVPAGRRSLPRSTSPDQPSSVVRREASSVRDQDIGAVVHAIGSVATGSLNNQGGSLVERGGVIRRATPDVGAAVRAARSTARTPVQAQDGSMVERGDMIHSATQDGEAPVHAAGAVATTPVHRAQPGNWFDGDDLSSDMDITMGYAARYAITP